MVALDDVSIAFEPATTTALIGPSGCGKSTALRTLVGLVRPDAGRARFDGDPINPDRPARLRGLRHRLGYVIQDGGLFPHLTARQNILLLPRHLRLDADDTARRLDHLVELTRFPKAGLDRFPSELSGGQRQRVALMRALAHDPEALLLDEPLGALDPLIRADLQTDLKAIFADLKKTVVLVTHDLAEAAFLAPSIVLMREGRVVQHASYRELVERPAEPFVRDFVTAQTSRLRALETTA
ncbi:MAG: ATP-binding cassette domain-containing protein [Planctomycetota bacterium]